MATEPWPARKWPEGVSREISGFDRPLFSLMDRAAQKFGDRVYTIFNDGRRTFAEVEDTADRVASFLASSGLAKGDRVAIFLPNLPQYPPVFFGTLKAGGVCVPCNPLYTASELNFQLKDAGAKVVFCMDHPSFYATATEAARGTDVHSVVICGVKSYLPKLKAFVGGLLGKIPRADSYQPGHLFFDEVVAAAAPEPPSVSIEPQQDLALVIYTGGTTGRPKGAALTHSNLTFDVMALLEWIRVVQEPGGRPEPLREGGFHCFLGALPWYHSFGMTACMLLSCASGSRLVCIPDPRAGSPPLTDVLKAIQRYRCTTVMGVPTIFVAIANHPLLDRFDLSSVVACGSGGAPMPADVAQQFEAKTGSIIFEGYGLSETAPLVSLNPTNSEGRRFGSVGFPIPNTTIKILDVETGTRELPQGEDGEIAVSGPQVMLGYWQKPEETGRVFREIDGARFFLTGDIGHVDADGYIVITDRSKDLILVGGFNCYPREVEDVLFAHPKVALAAVVGLPDPRSGERVKAFVQLKPGAKATEQEFIDFCRTRLAPYKCPKEVEFRESLPLSPLGKVLRRVLKEEQRVGSDSGLSPAESDSSRPPAGK